MNDNSTVVDIISSNISMSLQAKRPVRRDKKQKDFQYGLQRFSKELKEIEERLRKLGKDIDKAKKFFLKSSKDKIRDQLSEKIDLLQEAKIKSANAENKNKYFFIWFNFYYLR